MAYSYRQSPDSEGRFQPSLLIGEEGSMRVFLWSLLVLLATVLGSTRYGQCENTGHLFLIERSKNGNIVQYDVHTTQDGDLVHDEPISAYWILEDGRKQELSVIQKTCAYGVIYQGRRDGKQCTIALSAMTEREITVKKTEDGYKAFVQINGSEAILERIYVEAEERLAGLPRVLYVDLFGRDDQSSLSVTERIFPDRSRNVSQNRRLPHHT
jgi:hypothetical protein